MIIESIIFIESLTVDPAYKAEHLFILISIFHIFF